MLTNVNICVTNTNAQKKNPCFNIAIICIFSDFDNLCIYFNIYLKLQVILYCCTVWLIIVRFFINAGTIILILHLHPQALKHCSNFTNWKVMSFCYTEEKEASWKLNSKLWHWAERLLSNVRINYLVTEQLKRKKTKQNTFLP